ANETCQDCKDNEDRGLQGGLSLQGEYMERLIHHERNSDYADTAGCNFVHKDTKLSIASNGFLGIFPAKAIPATTGREGLDG
ncbi:MAG: hypothetical protein ACI4BG_02935, partial [Prevotella sp.]